MPADKTAVLTALVVKHAKAKKALVKATQEELNLRLELAEALVPAAARKEGANSGLVDGVKFTITQPINRRIDIAQLDALYTDLPKETYAAIFRWKPEVVAAPFRAAMDASADKNVRKILGAIVTEAPGTPQLEIK